MNKNIQLLLNECEKLEWSVSEIDDGYVTLSKFSPAGQDFSFTVKVTNGADDFIQDVLEFYENYDVSYETYLWLDSFGHGTNGAPYDMKDLYEDMEECANNVKELYDALVLIELDDEEE